ncbi:MAG: hypothetical protein F4Y18_04380, partial [Cenarchaeum sp. SB0663_bin_5]|nr:hypothetical protein [Cenarchaeum sp. SB0663_bin_5]
MKSKFLPALLLSIVVIAGTTTISDVFAQTNTEKLTTVVNTTDDTNSVVKMIQEALSSLMASIDALTGSVDQLSSDVSSSNAEITSKLSDIEAAMAAGASLAIAIDNLANEIDAVKDAVEHVDEHIESMGDSSDLQATVDDLSTSTNARLNALEENMNQKLDALQTQLSSISENLGVVQETVAPDPSATAIPSLMNEVQNNVIKASFYAKQFAATNNEGAIGTWPKNADAYGLEYDFTFSCDKPVLVDTVTVEAAGPLDDVSAPTDATDNSIDANDGYGHPITAQQYYDGTDATLLDPATTIKVNGRTLVDTNFEVSADNNVAYIQPANFELMHLNPGQPLNFKTVINFRAYTDYQIPQFNNASGVTGSLLSTYGISEADVAGLNIPYYPTMGSHAVNDTFSLDTFANLTNGNSTQLEHFDFDIFKVNVDYISLSGSNAECALSLPDDPTTYPKKDTLLINLAATGDGLIKNFEATVDCNDRPTRIVGNELRASHAVGDSAVAASNLKIEAGGQSMS